MKNHMRLLPFAILLLGCIGAQAEIFDCTVRDVVLPSGDKVVGKMTVDTSSDEQVTVEIVKNKYTAQCQGTMNYSGNRRLFCTISNIPFPAFGSTTCDSYRISTNGYEQYASSITLAEADELQLIYGYDPGHHKFFDVACFQK